jgi:Na+/phosphate symporter
MKDNHIFFNPFRLISPKLDAEANRLAELYESPPEELTCLEEGMLVMLMKLHELSDLLYKCLMMDNKSKFEQAARLAKEIHEEEKALTNALICSPTTTGDVLKAVLLFPGKLERCGDYFEGMLSVAAIKVRDGIPFSDRAVQEMKLLFDLLGSVLKNMRDLLATLNPTLLQILLKQHVELGEMTVTFALAHEDRLIEGLCIPKASSLYLHILDSVRNINKHLQEMSESLHAISKKYNA